MTSEPDKNSMLTWWPKTKDLPVPQPKTAIIRLEKIESDGSGYHASPVDHLTIRIQAEKIGYPVFLRTDQSSGKHDWDDCCVANDPEDLRKKVDNTITDSLMNKNLSVKAIAIREYIPMATVFNAFWGTPINPEQRYFVYSKGIIECSHPYWVEDAIYGRNLPDDWKARLKAANTTTLADHLILMAHTRIIANALGDGYWSIDFCKGANGVWYFIDTARGEQSWHDKTCQNIKLTGHSQTLFRGKK